MSKIGEIECFLLMLEIYMKLFQLSKENILQANKLQAYVMLSTLRLMSQKALILLLMLVFIMIALFMFQKQDKS